MTDRVLLHMEFKTFYLRNPIKYSISVSNNAAITGTCC